MKSRKCLLQQMICVLSESLWHLSEGCLPRAAAGAARTIPPWSPETGGGG